MMLVVVVAATVAAVSAADEPTVKVTLKQGAILGSREEATNGRVYYSFKTIPYARPPIGPLRFKDPEPAPAWTGVRNGSLSMPKCSQANFLVPGAIEGQEDCLYLNVYTPRPYRSNLPVMVYIHGGGFIIGSAGESASPSPMMQKDVVVVAMNYRLGALGFLSTGNSVLPGNLGLKDQNLALRWVQDNIRNLGGNPQQVTIFGVSAGGISVHFHIISPSSAGLFQRAILQSGTALLPGLFRSSRAAPEGAISISKALNCTGTGSQQLLDCFRQATVEDLVKIQTSLSELFNKPPPYGPSIDGDFLPDHPATLLKHGRYNKVDVMAGSTKDDGSPAAAALFNNAGKEALQKLNNNFTEGWVSILSLREEENPIYLTQRVVLKYMRDKKNLNITRENEIAFSEMLSDYFFHIPTTQTIEFHAKDSGRKTFMYHFAHHPERSYEYIIRNATQERKMAGHGDDMRYLFQFPEPLGPMHRLQDLHMQEILVTLWTNFASTGNPTINGTLGFRWIPVASKGPLHYLSLTTNPAMQPVDSKNREFWNSLPTWTTKQLYPEHFLQDINRIC